MQNNIQYFIIVEHRTRQTVKIKVLYYYIDTFCIFSGYYNLNLIVKVFIHHGSIFLDVIHLCKLKVKKKSFHYYVKNHIT